MAQALGLLGGILGAGEKLMGVLEKSPTCVSSFKVYSSQLMLAVLSNVTSDIISVLDDEDPDDLNERRFS